MYSRVCYRTDIAAAKQIALSPPYETTSASQWKITCGSSNNFSDFQLRFPSIVYGNLGILVYTFSYCFCVDQVWMMLEILEKDEFRGELYLLTKELARMLENWYCRSLKSCSKLYNSMRRASNNFCYIRNEKKNSDHQKLVIYKMRSKNLVIVYVKLLVSFKSIGIITF